MTTPTQGEHAQPTPRAIQRFEVVDCIDSQHVPAVIPRANGPWVRYEDHAAQVAALTAATAQPAAPQCAAYAELPAPESYGTRNGRMDPEQPLFAADDMRDFADDTHALRASHGQAPAGATAELAAAWSRLSAWWNDWASTQPQNDEIERAEWDEWQAVRRAMANQTTPTAQAAPATGAVAGPDDDIDAIALTRYKVVPSHDSMFHRFAVVAGDGKQQLYLGRETECQNMARKFAGAFLDGAFYQSQIATAPTPAAQTDSVLEDAARYQWLRLALADRTNNGKSHWFCSIAAGHPEELDAAIDAAMNKGGAA